MKIRNLLFLSIVLTVIVSCKKEDKKPDPVITPTGTTSDASCAQSWMTQNLDVSSYRNGDPIPQVSDPDDWKTLETGAWCYYNNDPILGAIYGKLYNGYAVKDPRGLAPIGWHIPTIGEWAALKACLGGAGIAGGKMKETGTVHWTTPNTGATNTSEFSALPGGCRIGDGSFSPSGSFTTIGESLGSKGFWWSSTQDGPFYLFDYAVYYLGSEFYENSYDMGGGFSVRCVKD